jgi:hypothetical protein
MEITDLREDQLSIIIKKILQQIITILPFIANTVSGIYFLQLKTGNGMMKKLMIDQQ